MRSMRRKYMAICNICLVDPYDKPIEVRESENLNNLAVGKKKEVDHYKYDRLDLCDECFNKVKEYAKNAKPKKKKE